MMRCFVWVDRLPCWLAEEMLGTKPSSSRQHKEVMHKIIFQQHKELPGTGVSKAAEENFGS